MKIKSYIPIILCALAVAGCSDADKNVGFNLDTNTFTLDADGGTREIRITADKNWIATSDQPWIAVSPANGHGTADVKLLIDSALTDQPRRGYVRIQNQATWEKREITIDQKGYQYAIELDEQEVAVSNYAAYGKRSFDVRIKTNVDFDIKVPDNARWLTYDKYSVELDRGIRPREVTVRFNWDISSTPQPRIADVAFQPKSEVVLSRQDNLVVTQKAAEPIEENTRSGDSVALLSIARSLDIGTRWSASERMDLWDGVTLWEEGMEGYTPEKNGRVKYAYFSQFATKEALPFEVKYLTAAEELVFFGNSNAFLYSLDPGEDICELTQLRRLTISSYGLTKLSDKFTNLTNLEFLDLSSNNFQKIPAELSKDNFPKLRSLVMNANTRHNIYDLSNTVKTNFGGFYDEDGFPRRMIEWGLDTLVLSVNYLQGSLPEMDDWEKYTEQDIIDADTLPRALIGTPKVMPHTKRFTINLNRLTGKIPDWLLYHPALDWWAPFQLVFSQEGKDANGKLAGFDDEPTNLNYYYEFYKGFKNPNLEDDEDEQTPGTK